MHFPDLVTTPPRSVSGSLEDAGKDGGGKDHDDDAHGQTSFIRCPVWPPGSALVGLSCACHPCAVFAVNDVQQPSAELVEVGGAIVAVEVCFSHVRFDEVDHLFGGFDAVQHDLDVISEFVLHFQFLRFFCFVPLTVIILYTISRVASIDSPHEKSCIILCILYTRNRVVFLV